MKVADEQAGRAEEADQLRRTAVERACYRAEWARYLAADPDNRLVAEPLESDWNTALRELSQATDAYKKAKTQTTAALDEGWRPDRGPGFGLRRLMA